MPITAQQRASRFFNLYTNSKRLAWDPASIDLTADKAQWAMITRDYSRERYDEQIHRLCSLFYQGEESVTETLSPFLGAVNRLALGVDQEMYLTSQVYEEAKHFEFFARYFADVFEDDGTSAARQMTPEPQAVLVDDLAEVTARLRREDDPVKLRACYAEAVTHYMGVVEAMLARTGYLGAHDALHARGWLPGLQEGFRLIRRDEGRHVAYGMYAIADLCGRHPELRDVVQATMERHLPNVLATVSSFAFEYPIVDLQKLTDYSLAQYQRFMGAAGVGGSTIDLDALATDD
jgi:ribonucleoside-diphosphate reductase beta chain